MSGVYIKGIEMPTVCEECPCFVFVDTGTMPSCGVLHEDMGIEQAESYRLKNCPLVPVPDHGRLGDLDAFALDESEAYMSAQAKLGNCDLTSLVNEAVHAKIQMLIADTPTVIEADRSE